MANTVFKLRRSSVSGKWPNTSTLAIGELAINLTDRKLFSTDGVDVFEIGSNVGSITTGSLSANLIYTSNVEIANTIITQNIEINGGLRAGNSYGNSGLFLTSNGSSIYWSNPSSTIEIPQIYQTEISNGIKTEYAVTGGYDANSLSVYVNGVRMTGSEANVSSGSNVSFSVAPSNNSIIEFVGYMLDGLEGTHVNFSATGDGTTNTYVVIGGYDPYKLNVFLNGIRAANSEINVSSGNSIIFNTPPLSGVNIDAFGIKTLNPLASYVSDVFTADGITTVFNSSGSYNANRLSVYLNGVKLTNSEANTSSGSSIVFSTAPANGAVIETYGVYVAEESYIANASVSYTWTNNHYWGSTSEGAAVNSSVISVGNSTVNLVINSSSIYVSGSPLTGTNTGAQYTWTNNHSFNANITLSSVVANGSLGSANQVLTSNGSTVYWADATGGGGAAAAVRQQYTGDGTTSVFTVTSGYDANQISVFLNGVLLRNGVEANVQNGSTFSISPAPANGDLIEVVGAYTVYSSSNLAIEGMLTVGNSTVNTQITAGNIALNGSRLSIGNSTVNVVVDSTSITIGGQNINGTSFEGTANNVNYVGSVSAANVVSNAQLQANVTTLETYADNKAANAYSNSVSYTDTKIGTANAAITGNAAAAYSNAVSYIDTKIGSANAAITGNASSAYTNATIFAANASNINTGTIAEARLPYRLDQNVRTSDSVEFAQMTLTGNLVVSGNVNIIGANNLSISDNMIYLNSNNDISNPDIGIAGNYNDGTYHHAGFFRDASDGIWKVFDNYQPEPDANVYIDTTNTTFHLANFQANAIYLGNTSTNWIVGNTSGIFAGATLIGNSTGPYGKTESSLSVATSNNSTYAFGKSEGALNVNSSLSSNNSSYLGGTVASGYQTTAGLSANVAALTSNNSTYAFGKSEGALNVNSALTSNNTSYVGSIPAANVVSSAQLSSNLANYAALSGATMTGTIIGKPNSGGAVWTSSDTGALSVRSNTSTDSASISFHRPGLYAINMGLDTDNFFRIGGWSDGAGVYRAEIAGPSGTSIINSTLNVIGEISNRYGSLAIPGTSLYSVPPGKSKATYSCTGGNQTFVVPAGVTAIYVKMWGAGGGGGVSGGWNYGSVGGGGGCSIGLIPVTPGETLYIVVGAGGQTNYASGQTLIYGGGGGLKNNSDNRYAGAGGGYTGIFRSSIAHGNALMIAGGGGGGGSSRAGFGNFGGAGGGTQGQRGGSSYDGKYNYGGGGGTQSGGGTGISQSGGALYGGYGGEPGNGYGGGGGGGYYGGAGGGYSESNTMAGGGGGSGYLAASVLFGKTFSGFKDRPAMYDDPDLPKTIDGYNNWSHFATGGELTQTGGQYTSTGGGSGCMVIYY